MSVGKNRKNEPRAVNPTAQLSVPIKAGIPKTAVRVVLHIKSSFTTLGQLKME